MADPGGIRPRAISQEEAREWLLKYLADVPERDDAWYARVFRICNPDASRPATLMSHGEP